MRDAQIQNDAQIHIQIHTHTQTRATCSETHTRAQTYTTQTFDQPAIGSLLEEPNYKDVDQFGFLQNVSYGLNEENIWCFYIIVGKRHIAANL